MSRKVSYSRGMAAAAATGFRKNHRNLSHALKDMRQSPYVEVSATLPLRNASLGNDTHF